MEQLDRAGRGNKRDEATVAGSGKARPPSQPVAGAKVSRRRVLRLLGLGALAAASVPVLPSLLRSTVAKGQPLRVAGKVTRAPNGRIRQWAMVIDLRYCDGCQSIDKPPQCTRACIEGHFVPEPMEWIEVYEADLPGGEGTQFIPTPCQQCQNPPCVNVCPVAATFSTPEGVVLIDQDRCIGCRICMAACPYDRRFFNWGKAPVPPEAAVVAYDPEHQIPPRKGTVVKCDFCPDMARAGVLPYCVQACPHRAIYYGDLEEDIASNGKQVIRLSSFLAANSAYRLKEHLGTKPRLFYIPGHGEAVGRDPKRRGRLPTQWPWKVTVEGAETWKR